MNGRGEQLDNASERGSMNAPAAFTLIELMVVIAIIGILAGLIVGGAVLAKSKVARATAETQRNALETAIDRYKQDRGYYPPDNARFGSNYDSVECSLFYEITGCSPGPGGLFTNTVTKEVISTNLLAHMNVGGINNGADPATMRNYYDNLKVAQHSTITNGTDTFTVFGLPAYGPVKYDGGNVNGGQPVNPFHYVVTSPTNNPNSYDLWVDVLWANHTNRVSNWSPEPQVQ